MKIGIGSTNKAKINACRLAFDDLGKKFLFYGREIEFLFLETETSVPDMPLLKTDLLKGARERALFVFKYFDENKNKLDYTLGLEGGVYKDIIDSELSDQAFLQSWVYSYDGTRGYYGSSPALSLPRSIAHALFNDKIELSVVIDELSGQNDVRSNEGAFGILTRDLITRSTSFYLAVINAMVPFLHKEYYQADS